MVMDNPHRMTPSEKRVAVQRAHIGPRNSKSRPVEQRKKQGQKVRANPLLTLDQYDRMRELADEFNVSYGDLIAGLMNYYDGKPSVLKPVKVDKKLADDPPFYGLEDAA